MFHLRQHRENIFGGTILSFGLKVTKAHFTQVTSNLMEIIQNCFVICVVCENLFIILPFSKVLKNDAIRGFSESGLVQVLNKTKFNYRKPCHVLLVIC